MGKINGYYNASDLPTKPAVEESHLNKKTRSSLMRQRVLVKNLKKQVLGILFTKR
jgi:hypothetical protein